MALHLATLRTRTLTAAVFVVIMLIGLLWNHWSFFILFSVIILLVAAQPFALYLGQLNEHMNFGELQQQLLQQEKVFEKAMNNFVRMDSPNDLVWLTRPV